MKKTIFLIAGLLGAASIGLPCSAPVFGSERALEYTVEDAHDEIPGAGLARTRSVAASDEIPTVDGPALPVDANGKNFAVNNFEDEIDELSVSTRTPANADQPLQPPARFRGDMSQEEAESKYSLVQYRSRSRAAQPEAKPTHVQTPSMQDLSAMPDAQRREALKKAVRDVLKANAKRPLTTQNNSPGDVLLMTLPYGADARIYQPNPQADPKDKSAARNSYIYSIGSLCWNYPCAGKTMLRSSGNRIYARVGAGYQKRPASFLALLAMSNIMPNYEMKVNGNSYSIGHLIASEKASVSKGMNMSMALVGLSFYGETSDQWKNEMGETWTIERMVTEELNRSIDQGSSDVTDWLLGLTAAVKLYEEEGRAIRGPVALAKRQLGTYHDFVLSVQNDQNLWHPKFFMFKGSSSDAFETMYSSGHILRWLLISLPENRLQDPKVSRSVASLASTIARVPTNMNTGTMTDRQLEGLAVSLHALSIYNQRVFGDDPEEEEKKVEEKTAETKTEKTVAKR